MQQGGAIPGRTRRAGGPRGQKRGSVTLRLDLHELRAERETRPISKPWGRSEVRKAEKGDEKTDGDPEANTISGPPGPVVQQRVSLGLQRLPREPGREAAAGGLGTHTAPRVDMWGLR